MELHNLSDETVLLYDADHPANTWEIGGGVEFRFPPGSAMPPSSYLLVVSFSPSADPDALATFQAQYGLSNNVAIYGPFAGRLNNSDDRVDLHQPGAPNPNTQVAPRILLDRIEYSVIPPWPETTSGTGASLQRKDLAAFGNDPANWLAARASAGRSLAPVLNLYLQPSTLLLEWEDSPLEWQLEQAADLRTPPEWQPSGIAPELTNGYWRVAVPRSPNRSTFYRLKYL